MAEILSDYNEIGRNQVGSDPPMTRTFLGGVRRPSGAKLGDLGSGVGGPKTRSGLETGSDYGLLKKCQDEKLQFFTAKKKLDRSRPRHPSIWGVTGPRWGVGGPKTRSGLEVRLRSFSKKVPK